MEKFFNDVIFIYLGEVLIKFNSSIGNYEGNVDFFVLFFLLYFGLNFEKIVRFEVVRFMFSLKGLGKCL